MKGVNQGLGFMVIIGLLCAIFLIQTGCQGEGSAETNPASGISAFDSVESYAKSLNTKITAGPPLCADTTTANFIFKCTAGPCAFKCNLDDAGWKKCKASATLTGLADGPHTLQVKAISKTTGKADKTPATQTWTVAENCGLSGVSAISAGYYHTCALTASNGAKCWGYNDAGELGNGTTAGSNVPVNVSGLASGVSAISSGDWHTCALTVSGGLKCWGWNGYGELGNGTTADSLVPVDVSGLASGVSAIEAGNYHTCALTSGGGVKCWGRNEYGQLGNGTTGDSNVAVDVSGLASGVSAISSGWRHTCALMSSGGVKCWGYNGSGQLGNGANTDSLVPADVSGLSSGGIAISAGEYHTCALASGNGVKCWGFNWNGQLGNGTTVDSNIAVDVSGLSSGVSAMSSGGGHTCALAVSGGVKGWGSNWAGQLGNGTTVDSNVPVNVSGLASGVSAITAGYGHTCALTSSSGVKCWGWNGYGQLGNGTKTDGNVPVDVIGFGLLNSIR